MMARKLLILFLYQLLCHGAWTLSTSQPMLSSSAITAAATTAALQQQQQEQQQYQLAPPRPAYPSRPGNKILSIETNCTRDLFEVNFNLGKKFRGILFAKDFLDECRANADSSSRISIKLPTSGCGVRYESKPDGSMVLSVKLMLQMDEKLRQSSDVEKIVKCTLPSEMMTMDVMGVSQSPKTNRNGRMRHDDITSSTPPFVRVWLELGGSDGAGAVEVGQATTLTVRAVVPATIGVRVVDCVALDGLRGTSQKLLDERGCPIDEQVMPGLHPRFKETWSKSHEDDLVEKFYSTTFPAFKFPDREQLHFTCDVQLCKGNCPKVNCRNGEKFLLNSENQLARTKVCNSLAVTAPQIEIDRLRTDGRYNVSIEEHTPTVRSLRSEGTLCLSISNLAMAFCVLGLIFLVAVIVAVCCLLRSKSRESTGSLRAASTSMFSSSSESQSRFGSKLLIPYGGSMPYGRVY